MGSAGMRLAFARVGLLALLLAIGLAGPPVPSGSRAPAPPAPGESKDRARVEAMLGKLPLYFIENRGQEDPRVAFSLPGRDTDLYFTRDGVTFALTRPRPRGSSEPFARLAASRSEPAARERWSVKLDFVGANPDVVPRGQDPTSAPVSYFTGPERQWKTGLKTYASVVYADLWPGIDLVYSGMTGKLKYTLFVKPGADPEQIQLAYRGATAVKLTGAGQLDVSTPVGGFSDDQPYAYQESGGMRNEIPAAYALAADSRTYSFKVGDYDKSRPLVLDPSFLVYAGYIGGSASDDASAIAVDSAGNAYVTGVTSTSVPSFPGTVGPDLTFNGGQDAFVAKVRADGTGLVYAGYVGGGGFNGDVGRAIAVDSAGNAYIAGITDSDETTFPVKVGPDLIHNGGNDAFVAKVKADGTELVYAGYIGGANNEFATGIAVDAAGNAYVTGATNSNQATFPVSVGPDLTLNGILADAFVAKVKADGTGLVYAGYIGGTETDVANAIAVDSAGNAYVAGFTDSDQTTFPEKTGPDLSYNGGIFDAFVAKVKADGTVLVYAGYLGGEEHEFANGIAVDTAGNAYLTGETTSDETSFPVKVGPDLVFNGATDSFVAKVKPDGTSLVYAGYIGGSGDDIGRAIAVDSAGSAYVAGTTGSTSGFPIRVGPDLFHNGVNDAFLAKVKTDGTGLLYAGFIGGASFDAANGIAVDSAGNVSLAGRTNSDETTFPVTVGPDLTYGAPVDAFVLKVSGKPNLLDIGPTNPTFAKRGTSFLVISTAFNQGLGTAPASTTRYYLSQDDVKSSGDILLTGGSKSVASLLPGQSTGGSATVTVPNATPFGLYFVLSCADDPKTVAELDENDNCGASSGRVIVTLPDLHELLLSQPPASANPGNQFSVTDTVHNNGSVSAGASTTRYYFSTDTVKSAGDVRLTGSRAVGALNPNGSNGSTSTGTVTVTIPSNTALGAYHLIACADDLNAVAETSETNNCRATSGTVAVNAPVGGFDLDPREATVVAGEPLFYRFQWIHPRIWRELTTLQLRFVDQTDGRVIFWVLWDETSNTFRLVDDRGDPAGRAELPGSNATLKTGDAILRLDQTTVVPDGPTSGIVTLTLAMTFKSEAAGKGRRDYRVEVLATDDLGNRQGFDLAGTLRVLRSLPAAATLEGKAKGVKSGKDNASIDIKGEFTPPNAVALDRATLTLASLLDEVGGTGELTRGGGGAALLPLILTARAGGKPTEAIYETASGVRPGVRVEVKVRDSRTGLMEFSIEVDRATIPAGPALCSTGSPATTRLRTSFDLQAGGGAPVVLDLTLPWRCFATELETP